MDLMEGRERRACQDSQDQGVVRVNLAHLVCLDKRATKARTDTMDSQAGLVPKESLAGQEWMAHLDWLAPWGCLEVALVLPALQVLLDPEVSLDPQVSLDVTAMMVLQERRVRRVLLEDQVFPVFLALRACLASRVRRELQV